MCEVIHLHEQWGHDYLFQLTLTGKVQEVITTHYGEEYAFQAFDVSTTESQQAKEYILHVIW